MIPAIEPLCCRRCDRYRLQKTRCTSIFADSIACGLIGPFISLQRVRLGGDRLLPPEKQRGFWSMSGRTPAIVMVGQSADMLSCRSRPFLLFSRVGFQSVAAIHPGAETIDEPATQQRNEVCQPDLAARILRSQLALERELQPEMGIREGNLVRAGLMATADEWPWQGQVEQLRL